MNVSEPDGCHDFVSMFVIFRIIHYIIYIIRLIIGPRHVFVPHPRHENVAMFVTLAGRRAVLPGPTAIVCRRGHRLKALWDERSSQ